MPDRILCLWILLALFSLRVLGQIPVMAWNPNWLPPPKQWYSGLIAYPYLLTFQFLILLLMTAMILGLHPGIGPLEHSLPWIFKACIWFSVPYFGFMIYRWIFRVLRNPARRWYDTMIPIVFHCILAAFLWIYGQAGLSRIG